METDPINILGQEVALDTDYLRLSFFGSLQEADLYKLLKLHNLKHLNLSCSDLSDMHLKIIGQIKTLQLLDLDATEITAAGLHHLSALKQVHELRLKDNPQLNDTSIEALTKIEQLKLLHLENTSITIEGLERLLSKMQLAFVILGDDFKDLIDDLFLLTKKHPQLNITLKGTGIIAQGKLHT